MATATNVPGTQSFRSPNHTVTPTSNANDDVISKIREPLYDALDSLDQKRQAAQKELSAMGDKVVDTVKQNPLQTVLAGAAVLLVAGSVTGLLISRARQRNRPLYWLRSLF